MATVLIVDDHMAVRTGLRSVLRLSPELELVAAVGDADAALEAAARTSVDVALVDYQLPDVDGLTLCRGLKARTPSIHVILYTGHDLGRLAIASVLAGADGLLSKGAPADDVIARILSVAHGCRHLPELSPEAIRDSAERLEPESLPILGMRLNGTSEDEIASTLKLPADGLSERIGAMVEALRPRIQRTP